MLKLKRPTLVRQESLQVSRRSKSAKIYAYDPISAKVLDCIIVVVGSIGILVQI